MNGSAIHIENLTYGWVANQPVLDIDRLDIEVGERVIIYGPSGCGKSTLLGLIAGVLTPQSGTLEVLGTDLAALAQRRRDRFRAEHLGVIFQTFNLLPFLSVAANVRLGCEFATQRFHRADAMEGGLEGAVADLLSRLGLPDQVLARPVTALSVGQQQRVAVARALIGGPDIVIADEPTSALDAATRDRFLELLISACDSTGATLLFVSHDMALSSRFGRTIDLPALNRVAAQSAGDAA